MFDGKNKDSLPGQWLIYLNKLTFADSEKYATDFHGTLAQK
jgi:hypothetical protein